MVLSTVLSGALGAAISEETQTVLDQQDQAADLQSWRARAEQGDVFAQYGLGAMYAGGHGAPLNYSVAVTWFRRAGEQGHVAAEYKLGVMYAAGRGVRQDLAEAVKWYRKAADQGHVGAETSLGAIYAIGKGMPKDDAEALFWFRKAAAHHDPGAAYNLGVMAEGRGVQRDLGEAARLYREAADRGNATAQSNLGAMYAEGQGAPQDFLLAHMWLSLAVASGNRIALRNRDIVAGHMSGGQIAESERLVREWQLQRKSASK
jgi:hypothetical protein